MRIAVLQFPGSNCDQDALHSLRDSLGHQSEYVWHEEKSLIGFDGVFVPGGFTYGDYLRCGAIASRSPVMDAVRGFANAGGPVLGVCNGFQILCESGLLPGALMRNENERFVCKDVWLKCPGTRSPWTSRVHGVLRIPVAHGEGRYICDDSTLSELKQKQLIAFRYCNSTGVSDSSSNINGSVDHIAGIVNERGNVLGMMPHPERAANPVLGCTDGLAVLQGFAVQLSRLR